MKDGLEAFRLVTGEAVAAAGGKRNEAAPKADATRRSTRPFIKGLIDLAWFSAVMDISGKTAVKIGMALHFQAGLDKTKKGLRLTRKLRDRFRIPNRSCSRGLDALEADGLIAVQRQPGKIPVVDILDIS